MGQAHGSRLDSGLSAAFAILGKRWNGVILGVLIEDDAGFADLRRRLSGAISDSVLSARLCELAQFGLVERVVIDGPPVAVRYSLTEAGRALAPTLEALCEWARTHLDPSQEGNGA
jgi:DNA-binding HxlR family transcriptional regulator